MKIAVFGSSGKVGRLVVARLLADGHTVVAFIHQTNPYEGQDGVVTMQGSIADGAAVERTISGCDAVISTLGSWGTKSKDIVSTGTASIIAAMQSLGVSRLITLTGAGAFYSQDSPSTIDKLTRSLLSVTAGKILKDGEDHMKLLEASRLEWTTVRSPVVTPENKESYKLTTHLPSMIATVPRMAVARCMVDQLTDTSYVKKAPVIRRG